MFQISVLNFIVSLKSKIHLFISVYIKHQNATVYPLVEEEEEGGGDNDSLALFRTAMVLAGLRTLGSV